MNFQINLQKSGGLQMKKLRGMLVALIAITMLIGSSTLLPSNVNAKEKEDNLFYNEIVTVGEEPINTESDSGSKPGMLKGIVNMWQTTKSYSNMSYSGWTTYGNRKKSNSSTGTISFTVSSKISNSYSGSIKVGVKKVESVLGFSLSSSQTYSMTNTWNCKKNTNYKVQYRKRYKVYKVKQTQTTINSWTGQITKKNYYVTVKKKDGVDVRVVES